MPAANHMHKSLLSREGNDGLCPRLGGLHLPAELMERGRIVERKSEALGVRLRLGQGECLVAPCDGLIRIPKQPQRPGRMGESIDSSRPL